MTIKGKVAGVDAELQITTRTADGRPLRTVLEVDVEGLHLEFIVDDSLAVAQLATSADNAAANWAKGGSKACGPWNGHRDVKPENVAKPATPKKKSHKKKKPAPAPADHLLPGEKVDFSKKP